MALCFLVENGPHGAVSPPPPPPPHRWGIWRHLRISGHFCLSARGGGGVVTGPVGRGQGRVKHPAMRRTAPPTTSDDPAQDVGGARSETPF